MPTLPRALRGTRPPRDGLRTTARNLLRVLVPTLVLALVLPVLAVAHAPSATAAARPAATVPATATATVPATAAAPTAVSAADETGEGTGQIVLVGVTGLRWDDLGTLTTPALWGLSREGAVGSMVVRSVRPSACPVDGWLAVSAGTRAGDLRADDGTCRTLLEPAADGFVPGWTDFLTASSEGSFAAEPGLLGDTLAATGTPATGIGAGAAIALADSGGTPVGVHLAQPRRAAALTDLVEDALDTSRLVVVDAGVLRDPGHGLRHRVDGTSTEPESLLTLDGEDQPSNLSGADAVTEPTRAEQAQRIDARVAAVMAGVEAARSDATVLVVSLADSGTRPQLQLALATGPLATGDGTYADAFLGSRSTRQPGYVQATDVTPTLLSALGLRSAAQGTLVGSPLTNDAGPALASTRVAALIDDNVKAQAVRPLISPFYLTFVGINLLFYLMVSIGLNSRFLEGWGRLVNRYLPRSGPAPTSRVNPRLVLRGLRATGVAVAAIPVSTFLANLLPWWRVDPPSYAVAALVIAWVAVITLIALLPPWRDSMLGPLGVVAAITALVIAVDIVTGGRLQLSSLMGPQPLVAGRFYGFNNTAFSLIAASSILLAVALADPLVRRGRRGLATLVVVAIGLVTIAIDGLPSIGADFGGPPALVPGFGVLALLAAGVRLRWWRALGVLLAGAATVAAFAVLDWLRPADERTHLGRFVDTVLDGGLWQVVERKAAQNLKILVGSELTVLAIAGLVLLVVVLLRPLRTAAVAPDGGAYGWLTSRAPLAGLGKGAPMLGPGLIALAVTFAIGFALNDSGILIPAIGVAVSVPLLASSVANRLLHLPMTDEHAALDPAPTEPAPR